MAPGDEDPPESDPEEGPVLAPEELDITEDEHVTQIDEGRYVVSPEGSPDPEPAGASAGAVQSPADEATPPAMDRESVREWLATDLEGSDARYGFDLTATFEGAVGQRRMVSNDVVTVFESLLLWYAQQLDGETPVEEVLGILLLESNVPVRYPPRSLQRLLDATDVDPEDSVADLLAAVDAEDGVRL